MSDSILQRFIRGTISIGVGSIIGMLLGFASMAVAVRYVTPAEFGAFVLLQIITVFLAEVSGFGLSLAVPRFMTSTEDEERRWAIVNSALYFRIGVIVLISSSILSLRPWLASWFETPLLAQLILFIPLLFGLEALGKLLKAVLQGLFRFRVIGLVELLSSLINLLLIGWLVVYLHAGLLGLVYAKLFSLGIAYLIAYLAASIRHRLSLNLPVLWELLRFGFPLQVNYVMSFIFMRLDTLIIAALLGPAGTAFYEVARRIPDSLIRIYDAFRAVYFPFISNLFAEKKLETATSVLNNSVRWLSFITILGSLIALLFGNEIITLLFSEQYQASVPVFVILMIALNLTLVETTLGYSLVAIGDSDKPLIINIVRSITSLACNLALIPVFGFVGAAIANVLGNLVTIPLDMLFLSRREMPAHFWDYFKPVAIFGVYGLLFVLLGTTLPLFKIAIVLLFLTTCLILSVIRLDDLSAILAQAR